MVKDAKKYLLISRRGTSVNLGKWVLRYIFAGFIDEQIRRDEAYRKELYQRRIGGAEERSADNPQTLPLSIQIPVSNMTSWQPSSSDGVSSSTTPRANGSNYPMTPGMAIGVATPSVLHPTHHLPGVPEDSSVPGGAPLTKKSSQASNSNTSTSVEKPSDYFGASPVTPGTATTEDPSSPHHENGDSKDGKDATPSKKSSSLFGKKFQMSSMSFGAKKLGRSLSSSANNIEKPVVPTSTENETKSEHSEDSEKEKASKEVDDNVFGVVQKMRNEYDRLLSESESSSELPKPFESLITPSLPVETPTLKLPPLTTVIIQEETSGGSADLYRGAVGTVGRAGDLEAVEREGPMWLGELLLGNRVPVKEAVKVSFVLLPWGELLPGIAGSDG